MANLGYLQLTRNCYQKCQFCSNPPTGVHLDEEEMRGNIDRLVEMGYDGVILTGGEPSISDLLFPALTYARERKLFSRMITNGQMLADKDFFRRCVDAGLTHIHVSLHSYRREVHDYITQYRGAWDVLVQCLENVPEMGITCDINTVINVYNCDHLHENVQWICENFPFIRHFVWNNMDPDGNRAEENPDCIPHHYEFQVSLEKAMEYLRQHRPQSSAPSACRSATCAASPGHRPRRARSSRKRSAASASSISRASCTRRNSCTARAAACDVCRFDPICAGMFSMAKTYDERELSPIFEDPTDVIVGVLGHEPSPELLERAAAAARPPLEDRTAVAGKAGTGHAAGAVADAAHSSSSTRPWCSMRTSSTTPTSPTTGSWRAPAWRRGRVHRSRSTTRSPCPPPAAIRAPDGGFVLGVEHDDFVAALPDEAFDVVVLGASVFVRIEAAHLETQQLIAALRAQYPRSVLLLADGYVGGQHYMDYDAERVLARYGELDAIIKYPGERLFADPDHLATLRGARRVFGEPGSKRGGDLHEAFYLLDGIDVGNFDRFLERCFGDGRWQNHLRRRQRHALLPHQHGLPAPLHLLHQQPRLADRPGASSTSPFR